MQADAGDSGSKNVLPPTRAQVASCVWRQGLAIILKATPTSLGVNFEVPGEVAFYFSIIKAKLGRTSKSVELIELHRASHMFTL